MRILFVTPRFPYPPLKGDTLRTYHQIRALSRDHDITLLSMADGHIGKEVYARLAQLCARVEIVRRPRWRGALNAAGGILADEPLQVSYYRSEAFQERLNAIAAREHFDVVHVTLIRMLPYLWERPDLPVVVDLIDSLTLNLDARRNGVSGLLHTAYEIEYQRVLEYERSVVDRFPSLVVSSPADRQMLGGKHVTVIPNGVDLGKFAFQGQDGRDADTLIFTGNMGYGPNEQAVLWFIDEVWPLLLRKRPNLRFQVAGTAPGNNVRRSARGARNVEVLGEVPDMSSYLRKATVAICPMRSGSGIQNKVLEAMATGTPVVATGIANRGVAGVAGKHLLLADDPSDFASGIERLLDDPQQRAQLARAGRAFVEQHFRWEEHARMLEEVYRTTGDRPPTTDDRPSSILYRPSTAVGRPTVMQMTDVTGRGGAEKALVDIALHLDPGRYKVSVCATRSTGNYQPLLDGAGVTTFVMGRKSRWDVVQWVRLVRLMRRERVDVLHTHLFGSNTLGRLLGRLAGVPVIIAHEHWSTKRQREVRVDRLLYRLSDRILVPSLASKAMVMESEGVPASKIDVAYNGVDVARFAQGSSRDDVRTELGIPAGAFVIGMVGRLSAEKGGVDHLIRAVSRISSPAAPVLLIVGDGPLRSGLEEVAAADAPAGSVIFSGSRDDVPRLLSAMDIFVLPSLNEALPIVILEAMAAGLPVVATEVGGVPEIVEDGKTGLLVPPGNEDALYCVLQHLASDPELRQQLAQAGRDRVSADFTIDNMVEAVAALYDNLLASKRKSQTAACLSPAISLAAKVPLGLNHKGTKDTKKPRRYSLF